MTRTTTQLIEDLRDAGNAAAWARAAGGEPARPEHPDGMHDPGAPENTRKRKKEWSRGESNPRALIESPEEYADSHERAAPGAAQAAPGAKRGAGRGRTGGPTGGPVPPTSRPNAGCGNAPPDTDLARLVAAWAILSPDVRAGIVAALGAATPGR
ncbi:MAG: hypothetical protein HBSAPP03_06860 [Phycisphaerae bacterium]|nr:MAG: hypothetical protein HBSAPP03_06860 [Phycisphaerae bacterium]